MIKAIKTNKYEMILFFEKIEHTTSFNKENLNAVLERDGKDGLIYYITNTVQDYVLDLIKHEIKLIDNEIISLLEDKKCKVEKHY